MMKKTNHTAFHKITSVLTIVSLNVTFMLSGCGDRPEQPAASGVDIPNVFVEQKPEGPPVPIPEARTQFQPGDEVLLTGLIMGVPDPFVDGRAVFVLGDEATITPCDLKGDDHCSKPWDACCDPAEIRMNGTATIQVIDETGRPVKAGLKGVNGLSELNRVTVAGTVAPNSSSLAFVVNADAIHVGVR